jgi:8-oxo-dGTP pyrophosphatase MutT (NUDIX family)
MPRPPIPSHFFVLVVVRRGDRFLLVQEAKHGNTWYVPAGRVEPGESFAAAALRETLEETGVPVTLEGVLRVEHTPFADFTRLRVIYLARPASDAAPKTTPDEHSLRSAWYPLDEIAGLALRGDEVLELCRAVAAGCPVYPVSVLGREGEAYPS